eukprot:6214188-Pleurochrysis_carterae.AAC.1
MHVRDVISKNTKHAPADLLMSGNRTRASCNQSEHPRPLAINSRWGWVKAVTTHYSLEVANTRSKY